MSIAVNLIPAVSQSYQSELFTREASNDFFFTWILENSKARKLGSCQLPAVEHVQGNTWINVDAEFRIVEKVMAVHQLKSIVLHRVAKIGSHFRNAADKGMTRCQGDGYSPSARNRNNWCDKDQCHHHSKGVEKSLVTVTGSEEVSVILQSENAQEHGP